MVQVVNATPMSPPAPAAVSTLELRRACGQFATGVTVVTVCDGDGFRGMTASSFTSVSLDPPLVLISVDRRNRTHELLDVGEPFAVNILSQAQRCWSDRFAGRHGDIQHQFDDIPHTISATGVPILAKSPASFSCRVVAIHEAGDDSLFIGQVEEIASAPGTEPLLFFGGKYRALHPGETASTTRAYPAAAHRSGAARA
jgi:flavin reductase (DIM6/NTAB) family NADH-FMN oxidoreductase RutF